MYAYVEVRVVIYMVWWWSLDEPSCIGKYVRTATMHYKFTHTIFRPNISNGSTSSDHNIARLCTITKRPCLSSAHAFTQTHPTPPTGLTSQHFWFSSSLSARTHEQHTRKTRKDNKYTEHKSPSRHFHCVLDTCTHSLRAHMQGHCIEPTTH